MRDVFPLALAAVLAALLVIGFIAFVEAHEAPMGWEYPLFCCSNQDCRETAESEVIETKQGYQIASTGEIVPYNDRRVKELSQDGKVHVCQQGGNFDSGRVLCLLIPPRAF